MDINLFLSAIIYGVLMGGVYALLSMGLTLIFGVMGVINFAHGELLMLGMYASYWFMTLFEIHPLISIPLVAAMLFTLGIGIQRVLIQPILNAPHWAQTVITFGLLMVLQNAAQTTWTSIPRSIMGKVGTFTIMVGDIAISSSRLIALGISIVLTVMLFYFLNRTYIGKALRATAQNKEAARIVGINIYRMYLLAFGLGASLAGIAGSLLSMFFYVFPAVGFPLAIVCWTVITLGGLGNVTGALIASFIIALAESIGGIYIGVRYNTAIFFAILAAILLIRPIGLLGGREERI